MKAIGKGISDSAGRSIEKDPCLAAGSIRPPWGVTETLGDGKMDRVCVRECVCA